ncbi:hypothetical protein BASA82_001011 [Batrachochytrium salamandrivorans]|uniref:Uncharacterized protein n=1 Tax=Batrachochytrium salamandrivorans TaxID=1357716 RepID=A0ABQ8FIG5_9FUNG|nr:hypothetical protein BASA60_009795 [Batrachochytrium salamandrivorans]KAH6598851.1 hypothetical protein BASA50_003358 [Batrachochytrium salamandrivorans]KAH9257120.1 hypothetical protein BASA81_004670 [Batrachochytrium salamandrivorans]KAH9261353.1 hypothetical protein BASA82_001011 [Batrachochytrium salamandrivorans]
MRLGSFAMVSLLAITVSAQPPHNPNTDDMDKYLDDAIQNMYQSHNDAIWEIEKFQGISDHDVQVLMDLFAQDPQQFPESDTQMPGQSQNADIQMSDQSQDAATQSAQQSQGATFPDIQHLHNSDTQSAEQSDQDNAQIEMDRLTEAFKTQDRRCSEIDSQIRADERRDKEVRGIIDRTFIKLQATDISDDERLRLQQKIYDFRIVLDQLITRHKENHRSYTDATEKRSIMHSELQLFKDSQKLMTKHNSKNEVKVELSPDSCYNMDMLKKQYAKVHRDIDKLLVEQKTIDNLLLSSDDDALKVQSEQIADKLRILQNYNGAAREILWKHEHGQSIDEWISESLDSYMQNARVE